MPDLPRGFRLLHFIEKAERQHPVVPQITVQGMQQIKIDMIGLQTVKLFVQNPEKIFFFFQRTLNSEYVNMKK